MFGLRVTEKYKHKNQYFCLKAFYVRYKNMSSVLKENGSSTEVRLIAHSDFSIIRISSGYAVF